MEERGSSPSSSMDSSSHPAFSTTSSSSQPRGDLSTDLRLGLSITTSTLYCTSSNARNHCSDWPPIKPSLRTMLTAKGNQQHPPTFFVKVYMDGIPIGRKLDLFAHDGYDSLIRMLRRMFKTTIICPDVAQASSNKSHVLTYEDKEGDWMMVGDVPWELFVTTVKRLKITRADKC